MSWPLTSDLFSLICRSSSLWESDGGWQPDTAVRPGERPAGCPVTLPTLLHAVQENTGQSTQAFCVYWEVPIYMTWNWRWGMVGSVEFGSGAQQGNRIAWHWLMDRHVCCETFHLDIHEKVSFTITLTPYMVLPLFATRFADYAGGIRVSFIQPRLF